MKSEVKSRDSWFIEHLGLVVELTFFGAGLPSGTKLVSETGMKWIVDSRVLYSNALDIHKRYVGEKETFALVPGSKQGVAAQEREFIFHYLFDSHDPKTKPGAGENLKIVEAK